MSFIGKQMSFSVFAPSRASLISTPYSFTVSASQVEVSDARFLDIPNDGFAVVNADIDIGADYINYRIDDRLYVNFSTGIFNGYVIADSAGSIADIVSARIDAASTSLAIGQPRVTHTADEVAVNVSGISFRNGDSMQIIIGFRLSGDNTANTLTGMRGDDIINGFAGNDTIFGNSGSDTINAGDGIDTVYGGDGDDSILDTSGVSSILSGDGGNDIIYGGSGNDYIVGGDGNDVLVGMSGQDSLYGGLGDDYMVAGGFSGSVLDGGMGNNSLWGGDGNDYAVGGEGQDVIVTGGGSDYIFGLSGNDSIYAGNGTDYIYSNDGDDFIYTDNLGYSYIDYVYVGAGTGKDVIVDFTPGANGDVLVLPALATGYYTFANVAPHISAFGIYSRIQIGIDEVYLYNVAPQSLTSSNFLFL